MRKLTWLILCLLLAVPAVALGRSEKPHTPKAAKVKYSTRAHKPKKLKKLKKLKRPKQVRHFDSTVKCASCQRDRHGRILRNPHARREFMVANPCPSTGRTSGRCPGYVADHIVPLKRGGSDDPSNMRWQTVAAARAKDRIE